MAGSGSYSGFWKEEEKPECQVGDQERQPVLPMPEDPGSRKQTHRTHSVFGQLF